MYVFIEPTHFSSFERPKPTYVADKFRFGHNRATAERKRFNSARAVTAICSLCTMLFILSAPASGSDCWPPVLDLAPERKIIGRPVHNTLNGEAPGVVTFRDGNSQRIYTLLPMCDDAGICTLRVHHTDGKAWWSLDQTIPSHLKDFGGRPGVITYREGTQPQRIYGFVAGSGDLYANALWGKWANQGNLAYPLAGSPGVVTYREGTQHRIYAFAREYGVGGDGNLVLNWWNGCNWAWRDQGRDEGAPGFVDSGTSPGAISYSPGTVTSSKDKQSQQIYAFVTGGLDLHVNYFDGIRWRWADHGKPNSVAFPRGSPGVVTYLEISEVGRRTHFGPQWIYAFVTAYTGGHRALYLRYGRNPAPLGSSLTLDGFDWQWHDLGVPPGTDIASDPGVVTYREGTQPQQIYAFVVGANGRLYRNFREGSDWRWSDQGTPPFPRWPRAGGITLTGSPAAITYNHEGEQWVHAFVMGNDGRLYTNYHNGFCWQWAAVPDEPLRKGLSGCPLALPPFASGSRAEFPQ